MNILYFLQKQKIFLIVFTVIFCILVLFNWQYISTLPYGIHEWAKSDRLALAFGFFDNGMDFFHPRTFSLRPVDGITGVEFPLQAYLAAIFGKIFGREHISLGFHLLNIFIGSLGITFLFKWIFEETKSSAFAILGILPVLSSTFFLDYMGNYLPDPFACSLVFISFYFSYQWMKKGEKKHFTYSLVLLTLAALVKTSAIIYLAAFLIIAFFSTMKDKKDFLRTIISGSICGIVILGWFFYSRWLNETYESDLFLARILPITDKETLNYLLYDRLPNLWLKEFFIRPAYFLILIIVLGGFFLIENKKLRWWLLLTGLFSLVMLGLFSGQLIDHDYYYIMLGLSFIMLLYSLCLVEIGQRLSMPYTLVTALAILISLPFLYSSYHRLQERRSPDYAGFSEYYMYKWMVGGDKVLKNLSIPSDEKILVLDEYAPNLGLLYFGRKGLNYPYSQWKTDISVVTDILKEKGWETVVIKRETVRLDENIEKMIAQDFKILYEDDAKMVLAYKGN